MSNPPSSEALRTHPTPRDIGAAFNLLLHYAQAEVREKWRKGELQGLQAWMPTGSGTFARAMLVTRGRIPSRAWLRLTGIPYLPVLLGSSPLARLILSDIHEKDHRKDPGAIMSMSRRKVWIVRGRAVARSIVKECLWCRRTDVRRQTQRMGLLSERALEQVRPFQIVGLDLMGPLVSLRKLGRRREQVKCWVALYVCLSTRAIACWLMTGYDTDSFKTAHIAHTAVYGSPTAVTTDRGTQIRAAAAQMEGPNWDTIQFETAKEGTTWHFVTPGTPWRNGAAERLIGVFKRSLSQQIMAGAILEEVPLQAFLHRVASIVNQRPLTARSFTLDDFSAVTPRDLLLGAAASLPAGEEWQVGTEEDLEAHMSPRMAAQERKVKDWWHIFSQDAFPLMVPFRKWINPAESLDLGAIVMVRYTAKYAKDRYRLGRIMRLSTGRDGLVRTALVGMRNLRRGARESWNENRAGLSMVEMPVQRLVLLLPGAEQPAAILGRLRADPEVVQAPVVPQPRATNRVSLQNHGEEEIIDI